MNKKKKKTKEKTSALTSLSLAEISSQLLPSLSFTSDATLDNFEAANVFVRAFVAVVIAVDAISELVVDEVTADGIGTTSSSSSSSAKFSIVSRCFSTIDTGDDRFDVD